MRLLRYLSRHRTGITYGVMFVCAILLAMFDSAQTSFLMFGALVFVVILQKIEVNGAKRRREATPTEARERLKLREVPLVLWYVLRKLLRGMRRLAYLLLLIAVLASPFVLAWFVWSVHTRLAVIEKTLGGRGALGCDIEETVTQAEKSLVRIIGVYGEGSGFAVEDHYIMTNHHVVSEEPSLKVVYPDGTFENGTVVAVDESRDLALLYVQRSLTPLEWVAWGAIRIGQQVLTMGYPFGGSLNGSATSNVSTISAFRHTNTDVQNYIQTDGGLAGGMSGGPMMNLCGQVIGVNQAAGQSFGLAIDGQSASRWSYERLWDEPTESIYTLPIDKLNPDESPEALVRVYYNYISARNYAKAYELLSKNFIGDVAYEEWVKGFETQLATSVYVQTDPKYPWRVEVWVYSTDLFEGELVYQEFAGSWIVRSVDGHLRLWESNIKHLSGGYEFPSE